MSNIARRKFIQLTAVAAAGCFIRPGQEAAAQDLPKLEESDPMAQSLKYTHDASTVDPASRPNPAEDQTCANCALLQGEDDALKVRLRLRPGGGPELFDDGRKRGSRPRRKGENRRGLLKSAPPALEPELYGPNRAILPPPARQEALDLPWQRRAPTSFSSIAASPGAGRGRRR